MGKIDIEDVSFAYEDVAAGGRPTAAGAADDRALRDVALEVPDGQFLCVIGHSGSGKTTPALAARAREPSASTARRWRGRASTVPSCSRTTRCSPG